MTRLRSRGWLFAFVTVLAFGCTACDFNWSTWGNGPDRHGETYWERDLGVNNVSQLHHLWSVDLSAYVNSAPVVAKIKVNGEPTDIIFIGNEHGVLFALKTDGTIIWFKYLGAQTQPQ